uniref:Uncharacterized protein n=1 Tax=Oryza sativa subsp. japonica TaxID=39947 RepID=Q5Z4L8_ORYSJ|nr:hypothetical protein [Oryza sativa Japonica Group]BAD62314.1 hypothetical protein [Oryza sativa Japonica Group]
MGRRPAAERMAAYGGGGSGCTVEGGRLKAVCGGSGSASRWEGGSGGGGGRWSGCRGAARNGDADGGGSAARQRRERWWRATGGDERQLWLGCTVDVVFRRSFVETERWPVCGKERRSRRCKRRGAAAATATAACSRSSPESGRAREQRGESGWECSGFGKIGEKGEDGTGIIFIGSGRRNRGRTWRI